MRVVGFWAGVFLSSESCAVTCSVDSCCAPILLELRELVNFKERSSRRPSTTKAESLTAGNTRKSGDERASKRGECDDHRFQASKNRKHQRSKILQFHLFLSCGKPLLKSSMWVCKLQLPKIVAVISSETFFRVTVLGTELCCKWCLIPPKLEIRNLQVLEGLLGSKTKYGIYVSFIPYTHRQKEILKSLCVYFINIVTVANNSLLK